MQVLFFSPGEADDRTRLDLYLAKESVAPSRSYIQKLIADGRVTVNGLVETRSSYRVRAGDAGRSVDVPPLNPLCQGVPALSRSPRCDL